MNDTKGYEKLARLAVEFPELLVLRRFDRLSARILLRMQAELLYLELELDALIESDELHRPKTSTVYKTLRDDISAGVPLVHLDKYDEVKSKLQSYHETVLRISKIRQIPPPSQQDHSALQTWLQWNKGGNNFLEYLEADPWESEKLSELLSLSPQSDAMDSWLSAVATPTYHRLFGSHGKPNVDAGLGLGPLFNYQLRRMHLLGNVLCIVLSSLIPIGSIQGLYWMPTTFDRLVLLTSLIVLFAIVLMSLMGCRRSEVFLGTSAFAAVLVVFLQGLDGAIGTPSQR